MEVSGDIALGEGRRAGIWVMQRLYGRAWTSIPLVILYVMAVATVVMAMNDYQAGGWTWLVLAVALALYIGWAFIVPLLARRLWTRRGAASKEQTRYRVEDDGLHVDSSVRTMVIHWPAVLQLVQGGPYWLVMLPEFACPLPRRLFADSAGEHAFIGACLERITPEARARSQKAVAFVG
ncbi:MAG: hypothetical protein WC068_11540 [Caulobacter sp.]